MMIYYGRIRKKKHLKKNRSKKRFKFKGYLLGINESLVDSGWFGSEILASLCCFDLFCKALGVF